MDNLAHTLAGAALAEAGLKRRTALGYATLVIGANLPDIDVVVLFFNSGLAFRRGWTHGVLALFILPVLLTIAILAWNRWVRRSGQDSESDSVIATQILILSFIGVFSHPVLDWLNTYGLRWLMPFDRTWFYGDALFIIDPWLWLILLLGIALARRRGVFRPARIAVQLASLYILVMLASAGIGRFLVERGMSQEGIAVDDVMVGPVAVNPNRRQVVMRAGETYHLGVLDWLPRPRLRVADHSIESNLSHPLALAAARDPDVRRFLEWARFPYFTFEVSSDGFTVVLDDLRYSDGSTNSWAAVIVEVPHQTTPSSTSPPVIETGSISDPYYMMAR